MLVDGQTTLTRGVQARLWESFLGNDAIPYSGISAMPSLHVAIAVFVLLVARSAPKWLSLPFLAYVVLIMMGSVHLGWHYAIDGYVGAALAVLCWWVAGRVIESGSAAAAGGPDPSAAVEGPDPSPPVAGLDPSPSTSSE